MAFKRAIIIRYGAYGDHLVASPLVKRLKRDDYHVTYNCTERAFPVIHNSPYIDEILIHEDGSVPNDHLDTYWRDIAKGYDLAINLSETIEGKFLFVPGRPEYSLALETRREMASGTNFYDYTLEVGGYNDVRSPLPELYPTDLEKSHCRLFAKKHEKQFKLLWVLSGSSMHKAYPFAEEVAMYLLQKYDDILTISVGDEFCRLLEWQHHRALSKSAEWDIRTSLLMTRYMDCVVGPETGVLNAAGCYDTPKIIMYTHTQRHNLSKYFKNDHSVQASIDCSPCYRLIYPQNYKDCPLMDLGEGASFCACAGAFNPAIMIKKIEDIYFLWHKQNKTRPAVNRKLSSILYGPQGQRLGGVHGDFRYPTNQLTL